MAVTLSSAWTIFKRVVILLYGPALLGLSGLAVFAMPLISHVFISRHGDEAFLAVGLATVITQLSVGFMVMICNSAFDRNLKSNVPMKTSSFVQRQCIGIVVYAFLVSALWINSGKLLSFLGLPWNILRLTEDYLVLSIPHLLLFCCASLLERYILATAKKLFHAVAVSRFLVMLLCVLLNYLLLKYTTLATSSGALATSMAHLLQILLAFLTIMWNQDCRSKWNAWSFECLVNWKTIFVHSYPAMLPAFADTVIIVLGIILAATKDKWQLGVHLAVASILIPLLAGFHEMSASVGRKLHHALQRLRFGVAIILVKSTLVLLWISSLLVCFLLVILKGGVMLLFTKTWVFLMISNYTFPAASFLLFFKVNQLLGLAVCQTSDRSTVWHAVLPVLSHIGVSLPVALLLFYQYQASSTVIWVAYTIGAAVEAIVFLVWMYTAVMSWQQQRDAQASSPPPTPSGVLVSGLTRQEADSPWSRGHLLTSECVNACEDDISAASSCGASACVLFAWGLGFSVGIGVLATSVAYRFAR